MTQDNITSCIGVLARCSDDTTGNGCVNCSAAVTQTEDSARLDRFLLQLFPPLLATLCIEAVKSGIVITAVTRIVSYGIDICSTSNTGLAAYESNPCKKERHNPRHDAININHCDCS